MWMPSGLWSGCWLVRDYLRRKLLQLTGTGNDVPPLEGGDGYGAQAGAVGWAGHERTASASGAGRSTVCAVGYLVTHGNGKMNEKGINPMYQIFFFSRCNFMQTGVREMMMNAQVPVQVIPVTRPEEILSLRQSCGNQLILVSSPPRDPVSSARGSIFLWQLMCLQSTGDLKGMPVLLLNDTPGGRYPKISGHMSVDALCHTLTTSVTQPGYVRVFQPRQCRLSVMQKKILEASLAGGTVEVIARQLNISQRGVFSGRAALLGKLGLRNRLELMSLVAEDFL
ncbi:hypothetical protein B0T92_20640 [Salmonella enterica]|nr:hypothetical protein [Salmonella enterica]EAY0054876.1 hypothetical protein [Salmonella enterica]